MRPVVLILCASIVLAAFAPPAWIATSRTPDASDLLALHAVDPSLPPSADKGRHEGWQQRWISQLKLRNCLPHGVDQLVPPISLSDSPSQPPCPVVPTLLAQHVRLQV